MVLTTVEAMATVMGNVYGGDDGERNGDGNKGGDDATDALRINNAAVRENYGERMRQTPFGLITPP